MLNNPLSALSGTAIVLLAVVSCGVKAAPVPGALSYGDDAPTVLTERSSSLADEVLTVYKSASCGCCEKWTAHLREEGIVVDVRDSTDPTAANVQRRVPQSMRSCHTAASTDGHVFEGHIPARYIKQFLANPPADAIGLAVPGMPVGSPGMEMGDRFVPYSIFVIKRDGSSEAYVDMEEIADQFVVEDRP